MFRAYPTRRFYSHQLLILHFHHLSRSVQTRKADGNIIFCFFCSRSFSPTCSMCRSDIKGVTGMGLIFWGFDFYGIKEIILLLFFLHVLSHQTRSMSRNCIHGTTGGIRADLLIFRFYGIKRRRNKDWFRNEPHCPLKTRRLATRNCVLSTRWPSKFVPHLLIYLLHF